MYDVIVVGAGMAGLVNAAYLTQAGFKVLICEQSPQTGGLVNSFNYKGFTLDSGIRAIENSGIIFPMLKQLQIDVPMVKNTVTLAVENQKIQLESTASLEQYQNMLFELFPDNKQDIIEIIKTIDQIIDYMDVLYGIDNPLFVDYNQDLKYITKEILPWMFKYYTTIGKIEKLSEPVDQYLRKLTDCQPLIDNITQHFFAKTPTFFALSYFSLYLDYNYPVNGTGQLSTAIEQFIIENGGVIKTNCYIEKIDPQSKVITDQNQSEYQYQQLVWAADTKQLYKAVDPTNVSKKLKQKLKAKQAYLENKRGGESVLSVYALLDIGPEHLQPIMSEHVFYTPSKQGISSAKLDYVKIKMLNNEANVEQALIFAWLKEYLQLNTFEISTPAIRNQQLAPANKSAVIMSALLDYDIINYVRNRGLYEQFKQHAEQYFVEIIFSNLLKEFKSNIIETFSSTPLTIQKYVATTDGAIIGWSFKNESIPAVTKLSAIAKAIKTPLPDVYQAGQWTFSPAGLPTAILTGKLAADQIKKKQKRKSKKEKVKKKSNK